MDITDIFRSYVSRVKLQRNIIGPNRTMLKFKTKRDDFNSKAKDVVYHINKLRDYLVKNKDQYININRTKSFGASMTDIHREKIDCAARNIVRNCSSLLKELTVFIEKSSLSSQLYEHRKAVLEIVANYLKLVYKQYSDIRDCYLKRQSEYSDMIRVSSPDKLDQVKKNEHHKSYDEETYENISNNPSSIVEELTEEELQMFEVENEDLINELNSLRGEVNAVEKKVTRIADLQNTFTEMVMQQDVDIQRIDSRVIGATENVQDANLQLRKAVQNNASFRVYVLFFILLFSFTLLFLNWYND